LAAGKPDSLPLCRREPRLLPSDEFPVLPEIDPATAWFGMQLSEIFPLKERARTASICTLTNFCANWVVLFGFDFVRVWCGDSLQYAIYAVLALLGVVFVYLKVPETKGLTLEDITKRFSAM